VHNPGDDDLPGEFRVPDGDLGPLPTPPKERDRFDSPSGSTRTHRRKAVHDSPVKVARVLDAGPYVRGDEVPIEGEVARAHRGWVSGMFEWEGVPQRAGVSDCGAYGEEAVEGRAAFRTPTYAISVAGTPAEFGATGRTAPRTSAGHRQF